MFKVVVVECYKGIGNIGFGFVNGFGMISGVIVLLVGYDSYNICVVGVEEVVMVYVVNWVIVMKGGFVVVIKDGV